jgi:hypothetical protein
VSQSTITAFRFSRQDLGTLLALTRLQADTLAENGQLQASSHPAALADRLELALAHAARNNCDQMVLY